MKLGPVPQLDKIKKRQHQKKKKKNYDKSVSANYEVIIIFPIDG